MITLMKTKMKTEYAGSAQDQIRYIIKYHAQRNKTNNVQTSDNNKTTIKVHLHEFQQTHYKTTT